MTQVERLIRNLCEERRLQLLEAYKERQKEINESQHVSYKDLPKGVQKHIDDAYRAAAAMEKAKRAIVAHGYQPPHFYPDEEKKYTVQLTRKGVDAEHTENNRRHAQVKETIQRLRTNLTILCLGKTANESRPQLLQLQKDLDALSLRDVK